MSVTKETQSYSWLRTSVIDMNSFLIFLCLFLTSVVAIGDLLTSFDLKTQVESAKGRFENDFLLGVWYRSNEAIVDSRQKLLKLYTHYTVQQAEQVVEHITRYTNFTQVEAAEKRDKALATKNTSKIMGLVDCIFKYEDSTIQAYKMTGYNLHNCIRMAQIQTESQYLDVIRNFEHIKNVSIEMHDYYSKKIENCLDKICVLSSLIQSVVHYEKLQEDIATNVTEINGINTRYLLTHVALGCVSNSIIQIEDNYNIGKGLLEGCFLSGSGNRTGGSAEGKVGEEVEKPEFTGRSGGSGRENVIVNNLREG